MSISGRRLQSVIRLTDTVVTASGVTDVTATLNWTAVPGATGYLVGRDGTDSQGNGPWQATKTAAVTTQQFTALIPGTTYTLYCQPLPNGQRQSIQITTAASEVPDYDWSDTNPPWAYTSTNDWEQRIPAGATVVNIQTGSSDFYTNLKNTVNAAGARVIVRLGEGVYHLNQFRMYGTSGDPTYSFGFYLANLQGLVGAGPDKTFVQMDANSMSQAQLTAIEQMGGGGATLQMGLGRFDGNASSVAYIGGLTFRAADQQNITTADASIGIYAPQPAPHMGVVFYTNSYGMVSHVRFQAAARACTPGPPFECWDCSSQLGHIDYYNSEFDGRLSPDLNSAQPRRCAPYGGNNEYHSAFTDCWLHHSNLSRYAVNDGNHDTAGEYLLTRTKIDHISDNGNTDPAINGGQPLNSGNVYTECMGFESCKAAITITDCILEDDVPDSKRMHIRLTTVQTSPEGGRLYVNGGEFRNTGTPSLDGYLEVWVPSGSTNYWWIDGVGTTITVKDSGGTVKPAFIPSGWPPTASQLASNPSSSHYLVKNP